MKTASEIETLASLRARSALTTRQVGATLGLTQPRITQIENSGKVSIDQLRALADLYGVSFDQALQARDNSRTLADK